MWLFAKNREALVSIVITSEYVSCCWIVQGAHERTLQVRAYKKYILSHFQAVDGIFYNALDVQRAITAFLSLYNLSGSCIVFIVKNNQMYSEYRAYPAPTIEDPACDLDPAVWHADHVYMYPADNGFIFYVHALSHVALLQYKLLAIRASFNLICITSSSQALLELYTYAHNNILRQAQLAHDMIACNNNLENYFTHDMLLHIMPNAASLIEENNFVPLLLSAGIYARYKDQL